VSTQPIVREDSNAVICNRCTSCCKLRLCRNVWCFRDSDKLNWESGRRHLSSHRGSLVIITVTATGVIVIIVTAGGATVAEYAVGECRYLSEAVEAAFDPARCLTVGE
jgi:hypothetical protein